MRPRLAAFLSIIAAAAMLPAGVAQAPPPEAKASAHDLSAPRLLVSGDLIVVPRPYWVIKGDDVTTHGSPNPSDARIPLIFFGRGIKRGEYFQPASPADIAPTLGFLAGVTTSAVDGQILHEILTPLPRHTSPVSGDRR